MIFAELFHNAVTGTVFSVFEGECTSRCTEILDSDFGQATPEGEVLGELLGKLVIRYIPGFQQSERAGGQKRPHMTVVLEAADCFKCSHRLGRSAMDPDLVGCEKRSAWANFKMVRSIGCKTFTKATEAELKARLQFDQRRLPPESWESARGGSSRPPRAGKKGHADGHRNRD